MNENEIRYRIAAALLQADGPLTGAQLVKQCGTAKKDALPVLKELVNSGQVVEGKLLPDRPAPQYCWAARWQKQTARNASSARQKLEAVIRPTEVLPEWQLGIDSEPVAAFHKYIINDYTPPKDKRFLVFFQCSVRRPFSTSPSHGSMRRAITVATGREPRKEFESCPVHVVVLASRIGPVPYELEDVYPANVGGGGVKHFRPDHYARVRPVLARRMADYIQTHGGNYDRIASFTQSRYGEVMSEARTIAGVDFPIFPASDGPRVIVMDKSTPRTYWAKFWIQLYLEIVSWLDPALQAQAQARLKKLKVKYE